MVSFNLSLKVSYEPATRAEYVKSRGWPDTSQDPDEAGFIVNMYGTNDEIIHTTWWPASVKEALVKTYLDNVAIS